MAKKHKCGELNPKALAIALGAGWGVYVFILGILSMFEIRTFWISPELQQILATIYPGYEATIVGSFIGLFWAVICGAIGGYVIAWLHNFALEKCCK